jgi:hypothetical protein
LSELQAASFISPGSQPASDKLVQSVKMKKKSYKKAGKRKAGKRKKGVDEGRPGRVAAPATNIGRWECVDARNK